MDTVSTNRKLAEMTEIKALSSSKKFKLNIKGPWQKGRSTVAFVLQVEGEKATNMAMPELFDLNLWWLKSKQTEKDMEQLKKKAARLREEIQIKLRGLKDLDINKDNQRIGEKFIKSKIAGKNITHGSERSQINSVWRSLRALTKSLDATPVNDIQAICNAAKSKGANIKLVDTFKALLRFRGRYDDANSLRRNSMIKFQEPPYLEWDQLQVLVRKNHPAFHKLPHLKNLWCFIYLAGLRIGEALALEPEDLTMNADDQLEISVNKQLLRPDERKDGVAIGMTKGRKARKVLPLNQDRFLDHIELWFNGVSAEDRESYRMPASKILHELCKEYLEKEKSEVVSQVKFSRAAIKKAGQERSYKAVHMLRAGHVRALLRATGDFYFAANNIGDNPEVLRNHYGGFVNDSGAMADATRKLKALTLG